MKLISHSIKAGGEPSQPGRSVLRAEGNTFIVSECVVLYSKLAVRGLWGELVKSPVLDILGKSFRSERYMLRHLVPFMRIFS